MDNLKSPAFPLINQEGASLEDREIFKGFTKLEYAALMIAQGLVMRGGLDFDFEAANGIRNIKDVSIAIAETILQNS